MAQIVELIIGTVLRPGGGGSGGDADTLQGQNGAYYRNRQNHTGTQAPATILQDAANRFVTDAEKTTWNNKVDQEPGKGLSTNDYTTAEKNKLAGLESSKFQGQYPSLALLIAANVGGLGNYAYVDEGVGEDVVIYAWDNDDNKWVLQKGSTTAETPASIKSKYESNPDTNTFTDAEQTKLAGLATVATSGSYADLANKPRYEVLPSLPGDLSGYPDGSIIVTP